MQPLVRRSALAAAAGVLAAAVCTAPSPAQAADAAASYIARGRYLVQIGGCNDCHTPGYAPAAGKVAEELWLTGDRLGWRGPWGTTYAANLRLAVRTLTEDAFVARARSELRPPMPWFNLRDMSDTDVISIYRYLRHLGPAGEPAPEYVPPDREPQPPFVQFPAPPPR